MKCHNETRYPVIEGDTAVDHRADLARKLSHCNQIRPQSYPHYRRVIASAEQVRQQKEPPPHPTGSTPGNTLSNA